MSELLDRLAHNARHAVPLRGTFYVPLSDLTVAIEYARQIETELEADVALIEKITGTKKRDWVVDGMTKAQEEYNAKQKQPGKVTPYAKPPGFWRVLFNAIFGK